MPRGFERLTVSAEDLQRGPVPSLENAAAMMEEAGVVPVDPDAETAARAHLDVLLGRDDRSTLRALEAGPGPTDSGPGFSMLDERAVPLTETDVVTFVQTRNSIPVFGSRAVVEMDQARGLVSASITVAEVEGVPLEPELSSGGARRALIEALGVALPEGLADPELTLLPHPEGGRVYLTWRFSRVSVAPPEGPDDGVQSGDADVAPHPVRGGCAEHGGMIEPDYDYFVDAHAGTLLFHFPNSAHLDVPARCQGQDEDGVTQAFLGRVSGTAYAMDNPFEDIWTGDMGLKAIETHPAPNTPARSPTADWQASNPAAVSAHVNATRVLDFLFRILRRKSIDDEGMTLVNVVNCSSSQAPSPPVWINAAWWQGKMWYGQEPGTGGGYVSLSRHLDIIAHELFHGITQHTANLAYSGLPGALNESMSDIFGVIVRNWHLAPAPGDVSTWSWELGPGLRSGGLPLRDMAHPSRVGTWRRPNPSGGGSVVVNGYPDHMNQYVALPNTSAYDGGGVHWYSNIHNLAAHRVLTSRRGDGTRVFSPEEVAVLYYLVLTRLGQLSDFSDARAELLSVAATVYSGDPARRAEVRTAIVDAYDSVGIV